MYPVTNFLSQEIVRNNLRISFALYLYVLIYEQCFIQNIYDLDAKFHNVSSNGVLVIATKLKF